MRRAIVVILLLLLPITLVVASLVAIQANRPPDWQLELDKYIEYKDSLSPGTTTVQLVDRARRPWNFSRDMSEAVFGDSVYYQIDYSYSGKRGSGLKPRPFPPKEVWCVLLGRERSSTDDSTEETTYAVVFIAEHHDLHNADIVVHEGARAPFTQDFMESLSMIDCDLGLEQLSEQLNR